MYCSICEQEKANDFTYICTDCYDSAKKDIIHFKAMLLQYKEFTDQYTVCLNKLNFALELTERIKFQKLNN